MTLFKSLVFFLIISRASFAFSEVDWSAPLRVEIYEPKDQEIKNDISFTIKPFVKFESKNIEYNIESFFRFSTNQDSRTYVLPQDIFAKIDIDEDWSILFGTKIYNWGFLEVFSSLDFINSKNFNASFFDDEKIGEPVIELKGLTTFGNFELIIQPFLINPIYPDGDSPFGFGFDLEDPLWNGSSIPPQKAQFNEGHLQFNIKWEESFEGLDLLAFYSRSYEKNHFYIGTTNFFTLPTDPPIYLPQSSFTVPQMIDMHKLGAGLVKSFESLLFKTEFIYNKPVKELEIYNPITGLSKVTPHSAWSVGVEWNPSLLTKLNTSFYFEWQKVFGYESKEQRQIFEISQNDLALILKLSNNAIFYQSLIIAIIHDLEIEKQYIFSLAYEKKLSESIKLQARAQWVEASSDEDLTIFKLLENRSNYFLAMEYFF